MVAFLAASLGRLHAALCAAADSNKKGAQRAPGAFGIFYSPSGT
jgi:hypothetical protein